MLGTAAPDDKFVFHTRNGTNAWIVADSSNEDTDWHHLAGTYDGTILHLYYDGYLSSEKTCSITPAQSSQPVTIGFAIMNLGVIEIMHLLMEF